TRFSRDWSSDVCSSDLTVSALKAAREAGLLTEDDAEVLLDAWRLASRLRSAIVLWSGRASGSSMDMLPHDSHGLAGIASLLGDRSEERRVGKECGPGWA